MTRAAEQAPRRLLCVVNRHSQDGAVAHRWPSFNKLLQEANFSCELIGISRDHLVSDLEEPLLSGPCHAVLGIGGDGTHMAVMNALKTLEPRLPAGQDLPPYLVIPFGTGNNVGKSLNLFDIRRDWAHAIPILRAANRRRLDLGTWSEGYFADGISIGLDPAVLACRDHMLQTWNPKVKGCIHGYGMYAIAGVRQALKSQNLQCEIEVDGEPWYCGPFTNILLNNTRVYGGIFDPTPTGKDDDGLLDLSLITNRFGYHLSCLLSMRFQPTFIKQGLLQKLEWTGLRQTKVRTCRITFEPPSPVQVDGEYMGVRQELNIGIEQQAISVCVPTSAS